MEWNISDLIFNLLRITHIFPNLGHIKDSHAIYRTLLHVDKSMGFLLRLNNNNNNNNEILFLILWVPHLRLAALLVWIHFIVILWDDAEETVYGNLLNDIFWSDEVAPILPNVLQEGFLN